MELDILETEIDHTDSSVFCGVYKITETCDVTVGDYVYRHVIVHRNCNLDIISDAIEERHSTFLVELES